MKGDKKKVGSSFWLKPETIQRMDSLLAMDNCKSRSEFVENALSFYIGYLTATDVTQYLSQALVATLKGVVDDNENRLRMLLFKLCVEINMACHTIALHFGDDEIDRRELRGVAVDEVKRSCGHISYDNALDVEREYRNGEWLE